MQRGSWSGKTCQRGPTASSIGWKQTLPRPVQCSRVPSVAPIPLPSQVANYMPANRSLATHGAWFVALNTADARRAVTDDAHFLSRRATEKGRSERA